MFTQQLEQFHTPIKAFDDAQKEPAGPANAWDGPFYTRINVAYHAEGVSIALLHNELSFIPLAAEKGFFDLGAGYAPKFLNHIELVSITTLFDMIVPNPELMAIIGLDVKTLTPLLNP